MNNAVKKIQSQASPQAMINSFLEIREKNSKNTLINYIRSINEFFDITLGKNINNITWEDLESLEFADITTYKNELLRRGILYNSIKSKFAPVRNLFDKYLRVQNPKIKDMFKLELPKENLTESRERSYGALTHEEIMDLINFARQREYKGKLQALFFKTLYITAIRYQSLLNLKRTALHIKKDISGKYVKTIEIRSKGSDIVKPISDDLYLELKDIIEEKKDRVFNISINTLNRTFSSFREYYNIDKSRNIVIHSIKKASLDRVVMLTGDLTKASEQGDHKSVDTTKKYYVGKNKSLTEYASYNLFEDLEREYDITDLKDCSQEELLDIIEQAGKETLIKLIRIKENGEDDLKWI